MKSVVIVGAGDFGREVLEIFKDQNKISETWNILGFIDENELLRGKIINNYPILGGLDWLKEHNDDNLGCVVAINTCEKRKQMIGRLQEIGTNFYNIIHPSVIITDFVELGEDVIIQAGSMLAVNSRIGDHVHINVHGLIGHDAIVGNYCTIGPKAGLMGYACLGEGVYIGSGTTILPSVSIGNWSTIGAGAVVIKDIPANVVAVGAPARVIKTKAPL